MGGHSSPKKTHVTSWLLELLPIIHCICPVLFRCVVTILLIVVVAAAIVVQVCASVTAAGYFMLAGLLAVVLVWMLGVLVVGFVVVVDDNILCEHLLAQVSITGTCFPSAW